MFSPPLRGRSSASRGSLFVRKVYVLQAIATKLTPLQLPTGLSLARGYQMLGDKVAFGGIRSPSC